MTDTHIHETAGVVDYGPGPLPRNWRNVSGLDGLSDEERIPLGWHLCTGEQPAYDPAWQTISGPVAVLDEGVWRLEWTVGERSLAEVQDERLVAVRAEAGRRILAIAPEYRQRNLTARAAEIALFEPQPWSEEIQAELSAGAAVWAAIKAVRAASDVAEAAILAATTAEEAASVTADWPE